MSEDYTQTTERRGKGRPRKFTDEQIRLVFKLNAEMGKPTSVAISEAMPEDIRLSPVRVLYVLSACKDRLKESEE